MGSNDFSQPFFVGRNSLRFRGINASGYLPALEPHMEEFPPETLYIVRGLSPKERDEFNQVKAHLLFCERKINEHLDASKRKPKRKYKYT